jgi:hypothetical protein
MGGAISFGFSLASSPTIVIVPSGKAADCRGSVDSPRADTGYLCLYESSSANIATFTARGTSACVLNQADPFGAELFTTSTAVGRLLVDGTWKVTAP